MVRPSYVLGGREMEIVYDEAALGAYIERATELGPTHPVMVDQFIEDAIEVDVDALCDGSQVYLGGVMEHFEEAGVHSGDSACTLPPITLLPADIEAVRASKERIAVGVGVRGLLNVQYALKDGTLYVLEANPRASRTLPFVSKTTAIPLAKAGARIMLGASIAELRAEGLLAASGDGADASPRGPIAVKEAALPFHRFRSADGRGVDSALGPEMRSTGEVMGLDTTFDLAFAKAHLATGCELPTAGRMYVATTIKHLPRVVPTLRTAQGLGFEIITDTATAGLLSGEGVTASVPAGDGLEAAERLIAGREVSFTLSLSGGGPTARYTARSTARHAVPYVTTVSVRLQCQ
jgi:carbamoyl-phosphate synthase large subunit